MFAVTADPNMKTAVKSEDLADVSSQDIKNAAYTLTMDKPRLMTDELAWSKAWMNANLTGIGGNRSVKLVVESRSRRLRVQRLSLRKQRRSLYKGRGPIDRRGAMWTIGVSSQQVWYYVVTALNQAGESGRSNEVAATIPGGWVYVYPGSYEDSSTEAIAVAAGYTGARGGGVMQPSPNAATVLASGINVQNILSQGMVPNFQNLNDSAVLQQNAALWFSNRRCGVCRWECFFT